MGHDAPDKPPNPLELWLWACNALKCAEEEREEAAAALARARLLAAGGAQPEEGARAEGAGSARLVSDWHDTLAAELVEEKTTLRAVQAAVNEMRTELAEHQKSSCISEWRLGEELLESMDDGLSAVLLEARVCEIGEELQVATEGVSLVPSLDSSRKELVGRAEALLNKVRAERHEISRSNAALCAESENGCALGSSSCATNVAKGGRGVAVRLATKQTGISRWRCCRCMGGCFGGGP